MNGLQPCHDGFDEALNLMWCYQARARVRRAIKSAGFSADHHVTSVHVNDTVRWDRTHLAAFDVEGRRIGSDTLHLTDPGQRLVVIPEFDHDYTKMVVPPDSELERTIAHHNGWVINMAALRGYCPQRDRRITQRAAFLAHLKDMTKTGQTRAVLRGGGGSGAGAA